MLVNRIVRTKRKTIGIIITENGEVEVRAPKGVSDEVIAQVVDKKKDWINKKLKEIENRDPKPAKKEFVNGEGFLYMGKYYRLQIVDHQDVPLKLQGYFYLDSNYLPKAREIFVNWYREKALQKISERVRYYSQISGLKYGKITITGAKRRWGSCSPEGNLSFTWRLIMAPLPVIDYVVVHELVHTRVKNHSKEFWQAVKVIIPEYEKHEKWLKENGYLLNL